MILVKAEGVPEVVEACGSKGVKNVVVIGSGFAEQQLGGSELRARLAKVLERYPDMNLAGPNGGVSSTSLVGCPSHSPRR